MLAHAPVPSLPALTRKLRRSAQLSERGNVAEQVLDDDRARALGGAAAVRAAKAAATAAPVELVLRARFNPELKKAWFGAVMNVINSITMLSIVLTGAALIREHGTIEHPLVMPVTPAEIMASKVWSMAPVVLVAAAASLIVVVQGLLRVPIEGSAPLFLAGRRCICSRPPRSASCWRHSPARCRNSGCC